MPTRARRLAEQEKQRGKTIGVFGAVALALVPFIIPRLPIWIVVVLAVIWIASWPMARNGYKYNLPIAWATVIMIVHGILLTALAYFVWPRITISPSHISFAGYTDETIDVSIRNGRADDVYDVQVPFLIGYGKHLQDKFSAKVGVNGDPPQPIYDDYNYCFGTKGEATKVLPNEREVLIVNIKHLAPYASGSFSITYAGGEKLQITSWTPTFIEDPYSYSPMQATVGVRGEYRICKYVIERHQTGE